MRVITQKCQFCILYSAEQKKAEKVGHWQTYHEASVRYHAEGLNFGDFTQLRQLFVCEVLPECSIGCGS